MDYSTYVYEDPTGGGDDATLTLPVWLTPPASIKAKGNEGDRHTFELLEEVTA